jgi:D-alanyl-D-alanine carboxypeptidase
VTDVAGIAEDLVAAGVRGVSAVRCVSGRVEEAAAGDAWPGARFRVGSITKTFVAAAVLLGVQEGRIALDQAVNDDLPGVLGAHGDVTVRQLLAMRSGLPEYSHLPATDPAHPQSEYADGRRRPEDEWAPVDLVALALAQAGARAPDEATSYCNTNYIVLGLLLEAVHGAPAADILRRLVLDPLGLQDSALVSGTVSGDVVRGHAPFDANAVNGSAAWTAGAMVSSARDVAVFLRALLAGEIVSDELLTQMCRAAPMEGGTFIEAYGLGLAVNAQRCGTSWGHQGAIAGYIAEAVATRHGERVAVILTNLDLTLVEPVLPAFVGAREALFCGP